MANVLIEVIVDGDNIKFAQIRKNAIIVDDPISVDKLFELLLSALPSNDLMVEATFDEKLSYPTNIQIKNSKSIHGNIKFEITEFEIR